MAQRFYIPFTQLFTNLGAIGAGWKLYTYETLTTTPKPTYSNTDLTIENPNPVVADADGRISENMWVSDPSLYKLVLTDENDVVIQTTDPVQSISGSSIINLNPVPAAYWGTTAGTSSAYTLASNVAITQYSSSYCFFLDFHIACAASPTININDIGAIDLKKYTGSGTKTDLEAGDVQTQRYIAIIDGTDCVILNPEHPVNLPANTTTWRGLTYLVSPITIANNGSDANNDIDFSAGVFQFSDGSGQAVASALTKRLDSTWAAGNNQGGLFSGSKANSTWYHCFAIYNPTTQTSDFGFDTSVTAANIPSGYTKYQLIESIRTDGSGNILGFNHWYEGNVSNIEFLVPLQDISITNPGTSATLRTLTTPLGRKVTPICSYIYFESPPPGGNVFLLLTSPQQTDTAPSSSIFTVRVGVDAPLAETSIRLRTNTSSQIRSRFSDSSGNTNFQITTYGWQS